jgi:Family of unknown function (DUF5715)
MRNLYRAVLVVLVVTATVGQGFGADREGGASAPPAARHAHRRHIRWDPVFRPSRESLLLQNAEVDRMELPRIENDEELEALKASGELVPIVASDHVRFDPRLDPDRRYCRPWTRDFVEDLSRAYFEAFHTSIQVNSAVRTVQVQKKLRRHNRNAAPEKGELASSHLAGVTVDIQRRGLSREQVAWMQQYMMPLKELGLIEPEEERRQWVFHVMVSNRYSEQREPKVLTNDQIANESEATAEMAGAQ